MLSLLPHHQLPSSTAHNLYGGTAAGRTRQQRHDSPRDCRRTSTLLQQQQQARQHPVYHGIIVSSSSTSTRGCRDEEEEECLYAVLRVSRDASFAEIKAAFRRAAHELHPDKHHARTPRTSSCRTDSSSSSSLYAPQNVTAAFLRCKAAYDVLSDSSRRAEYDAAAAAASSRLGHAAEEAAGGHHRQWSPYNNDLNTRGWADAYTAASASSSSSNGAGPEAAAAAQPTDYYEERRRQQLVHTQPLTAPAAAAAAAGVSNSGFSVAFAAAMAGGHAARTPAAASHLHTYPAGAATAAAAAADLGCADPPSTSTALRAALLRQHGLPLEDFGSLQDALDALAEADQRSTLRGLAEGDYGAGGGPSWWEV